MNILQSALGRYEPIGNPDEADVIVGHSFGTGLGEGSPNRALARYIGNIAGDRPIVADRMLVDAFDDPGRVDEVVEGAISNTMASVGGSWGVLLHAKLYMEDEGLETALQVAQACHIGRVAMQAKILGMPSVLPPGLPGVFDKESDQWWTRNKALWVPREVLGSIVLRRRGEL